LLTVTYLPSCLFDLWSYRRGWSCPDPAITASATWATQNDARVLDRPLPPRLWNAAGNISMAERAVLGIKIPAEGSPVVCARLQSIYNLYYTLQAAQCRHDTPSHAVAWSECTRYRHPPMVKKLEPGLTGEVAIQPSLALTVAALSQSCFFESLGVCKSMKPPRSKLRGIRRKGIGDETPRFLMLFPLYGNP